MPKKDNLTRAKDLVSYINDGLTKRDFVESFKNVVDRVKRFETAFTRDFKTLSDTINRKIDDRLATIKHGTDYILTAADKKEIAARITVPIVEKEIIIKEQPIVTEITNEVPNRDMADDIRNKLELLDGDERLKPEAIRGLIERLDAIEEAHKINQRLVIGSSGVKQLVAGTGVTIDNTNLEYPTITATGTGGSFAGTQEKSTTTPDGSTTTFAFTHTPRTIIWNGAIQTLTDDYTISSNNITFTGTLTPQTGDKIINIYA